MLTCFDHATVVVSDLQAARACYTALFGASPTWSGVQTELGVESALFGLGNGMLELVAPVTGDERGDGLRARLTARGEGLFAIAFGTDDAEACRAHLRAAGVRAAPVVEGQARARPRSVGAAGVDGAGADATTDVRRYRVFELSPRQTRGLPVFAVERADRAALSTLGSDAPSAVQALDHVVVATAEPDAAVALYGEALGLRLALDRELAGRRMLFFRMGGVTVEVVRDPARNETDRLYGLAYRVADINAAHGRLVAEGFAVDAPRPGNKPGTHVFTVRDGTCGVPTLIIADPSRRRGSQSVGGERSTGG